MKNDTMKNTDISCIKKKKRNEEEIVTYASVVQSRSS